MHAGATSSQLPALPADSLFTIHRSGDRVAFRSLGCVPLAAARAAAGRTVADAAHCLILLCSAEGRTLQAVSGGEHQLVNYNLGPWESWAPHKARPRCASLVLRIRH